MSIVLENVVVKEAEAAPEEIEEAPEPVAETVAAAAPEGLSPPVVIAPTTPAPKKRGRPKKAAAPPAAFQQEQMPTPPPQAPAQMPVAPEAPVGRGGGQTKAPRPRATRRAATAPQPAVESSSEEDVATRADLEDQILEFLVARRSAQQSRRHALWSQLAGL